MKINEYTNNAPATHRESGDNAGKETLEHV